MLYILFILLSMPMLMLAIFLNKDNKVLFNFLILGMLSAVVAYEVNSYLNSCLGMKTYFLTIYITPLVEELIKTFFVVIFIILATYLIRFDDDTCMSVSAVVGVGFALLENSYFLLINYETIDLVWLVMRIFATGTMHIVTASFIGYGIIIAKKFKRRVFIGIIISLCIAILYHSIYNKFVLSEHGFIALLLPIVTYLIMLICKFRLIRCKIKIKSN